jgi:hypothetical protein
MLSKLDLSTPDVVEFISDFDALIVLEALRRAHAIASPRQLEGTTGLSAGVIETQLARLASFGLVRRTRGTRGRVSTGYSTSQDPLVLTFDPADPQSALRTATVRLSLLSHAARIAAALQDDVARGGYGAPDAGFLALLAVLGYCERRHRVWAWRNGLPGLAAWFDRASDRASFAATMPPVSGI